METRINNIKCKQMYFKKRGKNLLKNTAVSQTIHGVEFTVNGDGSVTANGTASETIIYNISANNMDNGQSGYVATDSDIHILNGCPRGGSVDTYSLKYYEWDGSWNILSNDIETGAGTLISHKDNWHFAYVQIIVATGYTCNNLTFKPMIRRADIVDDTYEPYEDFVAYKKVYAKKSDKNLLKNTAVSQTINGVEFVVNADGTVVANGLASETAALWFESDITTLKKGTRYILSAVSNSAVKNGYRCSVVQYDNSGDHISDIPTTNSSTEFELADNCNRIRFHIWIDSGTTVNNLTFYPMIRRADIADPTYEPYEEWTQIYSAGNPVTYVVDTGVEHTEEVDSGASCLEYKPTKDGYTFVGWRKDKTASAEVETNLVMGDEPMTLYAVFSKDVTLTYAGNGATSGSTAPDTKQIYYNNGNVVNPTFKLKANGFTRSGATFQKWAIGSTSGTQYAVGANVELSANTTAYAKWLVSYSSSFDLTVGKRQGDETKSVTITTAAVNSVTISGTIQCDPDWGENNNDGRCDGTAYVNSTAVGSVGTHMSQSSVTVNKTLGAQSGLVVKFLLHPHSSDYGSGYFRGTVSYTVLV